MREIVLKDALEMIDLVREDERIWIEVKWMCEDGMMALEDEVRLGELEVLWRRARVELELLRGKMALLVVELGSYQEVVL